MLVWDGWLLAGRMVMGGKASTSRTSIVILNRVLCKVVRLSKMKSS